MLHRDLEAARAAQANVYFASEKCCTSRRRMFYELGHHAYQRSRPLLNPNS